MFIIVCGGRGYSDKDHVYKVLDGLAADMWKLGERLIGVIHGAATGADALGAQWARDRGLAPVAVPANWDFYGRKAGPIRNRWMAALNPIRVIVFPGGDGTADMVEAAREMELFVEFA